MNRKSKQEQVIVDRTAFEHAMTKMLSASPLPMENIKGKRSKKTVLKKSRQR
jgi:hypothetical protein